MNFTEAKNAIGNFTRFFRALSTLDDVLSAAIDANDKVTQAGIKLGMAQDEYAGLEAQLADLKPKYSKLKQTYDAKMADMEAKLTDWADKKQADLNAEIKALQDKVDLYKDALSEAMKDHDQAMSKYDDEITQAKLDVAAWEKRLADAKKAYEEFKATI